jgi:glycosyltransferase involved in cell wall biosynthesis
LLFAVYCLQWLRYFEIGSKELHSNDSPDLLRAEEQISTRSDSRGDPVRVSIAMTTFNGATHLQEQLDSLAGQHFLPTELIVGDDGSTDGTVGILERFRREAPFPVVIHSNAIRLGYRANFMKVACLCTGDLISFCDQDDIWLPNNLDRVVRSFADPDVLLTFHNARVVDGQRRLISPLYAEPPSALISPRLALPPWMSSYGFTQTFRANLLPAAALWGQMKDHYYPDEVMGHDLFFFLIASAIGKVCYIDEELTEYRLHGGNTVGSGKRTKPGLLERWRYRFEDRSKTYGYLARVAPIDAELFSYLSEMESFPMHLRQRSIEAAVAWRELGPIYSDRARVCSARLIDRLVAFVHLCRKGVYSEASFWTFGSKAMIKDLVLGVALAPLVLRFGRASSRHDRSCRRGRDHPLQSNM